MNDETRRFLRSDLEKAFCMTVFLKNNQDKNFEVLDGDYLVIKSGQNVLPMNYVGE